MSNRAAAIRTEAFSPSADFARPQERALGPGHLRQAGEGDMPAPNQPGQLQLEVAAALAQGAFDPRIEPEIKKWSPRRTLAFLFVTCGTFWALLAWAIVKLF